MKRTRLNERHLEVLFTLAVGLVTSFPARSFRGRVASARCRDQLGDDQLLDELVEMGLAQTDGRLIWLTREGIDLSDRLVALARQT